MQKNNFVLKFYLLISFAFLTSMSLEAQTITMYFLPGGFDNCMNPLPNAGNYTVSGTVNGKNEYTKPGGNPRIRWTGSQWEFQADDPTIGGINFIAGWFNTNNTPTPPGDCWQASFGCFPIAFSGAVSPTANLSSTTLTPSIPNSAMAGTGSFTLTFPSAIPGLTASNFTLTAVGSISGQSITSVTSANNIVWTINVSAPTGDGVLTLSLANLSGTGAAACGSFPSTTYVVNNTTTTGTALSVGDIAFTGYNSSSSSMDDFVFVVLRNGGLPAGTQIYFTDDSYGTVAGMLRPTEGLMLWQATSNIPQFTQVIVSSTISPASYAVTTGTATAIQHSSTLAAISLSSSGDQLFAFQGNAANPTFITGIHMNAETGTNPTNGNSTLAGWDDLTTGTTPYTVNATRSAIPPSLTNGVDALMAVDGGAAPYTEFDNAIYNCTGAANAVSLSALRASINDRANWNKQDVTAYTFPSSCTFSVMVACTPPSITTPASSNSPICDGATLNLNVAAAGTAPLSYAWTGTGTFTNGSTASPSVTGAATGNYQVTVTNACGNIASTAAVTVVTLQTAPTINFASPASGNNSITVCSGSQITLTSPTANAYEYLWYKNGAPVFSAINNPNYTFTSSINTTDVYTLAITYNGIACLSAVSTPLTIINQSPPATTSLSGPNAFCFNTPSTLTANVGAGYTYVWKRGATVVQSGASNTYNPTASGNHNVTVTDLNGCSKVSTWTNIIVNPIPAANAGLDKNICNGSSTQIGAANNAAFSYSWSPSIGLSNALISNPIATTSNPITYTVTVTNNTTLCSNTDAMNISVLQTPSTPTLTSTTTPICEGSTIILTPSVVGATSVDWLKNGVLLYNKPTSFTQIVNTPSVAGDVYTVKNKDANGCYSPSSNALNAWIKEAPQPTITSVPAAVGANIIVCVPGGTTGTATLTASSVLPATYSWRLAGNYIAGANTNSITSTVTLLQNNKVYNAEATYSNGCTRLSANRNVKLVTSGCVPRLDEGKGGDLIIGLEETQMTVFPNPTNDFLNIKLLNVAESEGKLYLYNALGQAVYEQSILITDRKAEVQLDLQTLPIGIYTLSFQTNKIHQTQKIAKE